MIKKIGWMLSVLGMVSCCAAQDATPLTPELDDRIVLGASGVDPAGSDGQMNILFIGNSYTAAAGGQFQIVPALLESQGIKVYAEEQINAGETVEEHWLRNQGKVSSRRMEWATPRGEAEVQKLIRQHEQDKGALTARLKSRRWDVVVIQPWIGAFTKDNPSFHEHIDLLVGHIRELNPDVRIILYMTWAKPEGTVPNCLKAAERNQLLIAPAGSARKRFETDCPDIPVQRSPADGHPGLNGGYLAACTLYAVITGKSPSGLPSRFTLETNYDFGDFKKEKEAEYLIEPETARKLQEAAWAAVQGEPFSGIK